MAVPPDFRRLSRQDMPGSPEWVTNLISPVNTFNEQVVSLFTGKIDFTNLKGIIANVNFMTPANYSDGANNNFNAFTFPLDFTGASVCVLGSIDIASNNYSFSNKPVQLPVGGWREQTAGKITVFYLTGLLPSTSYNAIFLVF